MQGKESVPYQSANLSKGANITTETYAFKYDNQITSELNKITFLLSFL